MRSYPVAIPERARTQTHVRTYNRKRERSNRIKLPSICWLINNAIAKYLMPSPIQSYIAIIQLNPSLLSMANGAQPPQSDTHSTFKHKLSGWTLPFVHVLVLFALILWRNLLPLHQSGNATSNRKVADWLLSWEFIVEVNPAHLETKKNDDDDCRASLLFETGHKLNGCRILLYLWKNERTNEGLLVGSRLPTC